MISPKLFFLVLLPPFTRTEQWHENLTAKYQKTTSLRRESRTKTNSETTSLATADPVRSMRARDEEAASVLAEAMPFQKQTTTAEVSVRHAKNRVRSIPKTVAGVFVRPENMARRTARRVSDVMMMPRRAVSARGAISGTRGANRTEESAAKARKITAHAGSSGILTRTLTRRDVRVAVM